MKPPDKETLDTWNKLASLYESKFMNLEIYDSTYNRICDIVKPDATILDVGCGPGNIPKYLLNRRPDLIVHGIDIAPNMISLASKNNATARFDVMDIREIGNIKSTYDAIICGFCLPYLSPNESSTFIADAYHLLNTEGILYVSFVEGNSDDSGYQTGSTGDRMYFNYHDLERLTASFRSVGFAKPEVFKINYDSGDRKEVHTVVISTKP